MGSDERQYCSPGFNLPIATIMRSLPGKFKEYHTSLDNFDLISMNNINKMLDLYIKIVVSYEQYDKYKLVTDGGEPFLTKYNLYREIGIPGHSKNELIRNWIIHYCDGSKNIKDISKLIKVSENTIMKFIKTFKLKGLIK